MAIGWTVLASSVSIGQVSDQTAADGKVVAFDVVSIRPSGKSNGGVHITPDGYSATNMPILTTIMFAYFPTPIWVYGDQVKNAPSWVGSERYDIEAKVAAVDVPEWKKQNFLQKGKMVELALQAVLAERCKLVVHRTPSSIQGYELVAVKRGSKLKDAKANEVPPGGMMFPDGGTAVGSRDSKKIEWTFFNASMSSLAGFMTIGAAGPIQDKTGLTGKYDFVLAKRDTSPAAAGPEGGGASEPDPGTIWDLGELGLMLKPVKIPAEMVVIDQIERPSAN
jgi:uncharacterized protein (TIGR03435 family)